MKQPCYILFLCTTFFQAKSQFEAKLIEGDYTPAVAKMEVEAHNVKQKDPPHVYFDHTRNLWHATWTQFDAYKSKQKTDVSAIYYSRSDEGKTWTTPKQLNVFAGDCLDGDSTVKGPMPCVGPGGEVYVTWASPKGLAFQCSRDSGKTWLKEEKIINPINGGWSCKVDDIKTNGLPFIACDRSKGEFAGRIYICWSDEKNGPKNKDVFVVYSDDKGEHWTEPILVSYRPNHKDQFKPCMKLDTVSGIVYILYFDKQNYPQGKEMDLTLAISRNGGLKFEYYKVNSTSFVYNSNFTELVDDNGMRARWVQVDGSKRFGLYEVLVNDSTISSYYLKAAAEDVEMERSFKFSDKITVNYKLKHNAFVTAIVTKPLEPGFAEKVIVKNKRAYQGNNSLVIDTKQSGLKKGNYVLTLYYAGRNDFVWITEE